LRLNSGLAGFADARQMVHDVDAMLAQVRLWPTRTTTGYAAIRSPTAQDHFLTGANETRDACFMKRDANGALALKITRSVRARVITRRLGRFMAV